MCRSTNPSHILLQLATMPRLRLVPNLWRAARLPHSCLNAGVVVATAAAAGRAGRASFSAAAIAAASPAAAPLSPSDAALLDSPGPRNNVPPSIRAKLGANLHMQHSHPLGQLKLTIQRYFESGAAGAAVGGANARFKTFDQLSPVVSTVQNFDSLLTPADHVSRRPSDTYYLSPDRLLRCHMTAHQADLIRAGETAWLMIGDVYRRDEVDATHYPVFHQVDGVRVWRRSELGAAGAVEGPDTEAALVASVVADLKASLTGLAAALFGDAPMRWVDAYFPFTDPSFEMEIYFEGKWLEVLGCGVIRSRILAECGRGDDAIGWAFGMGLERLAMVLYGVPDIRLFWSSDPRFLSQFQAPGRPAKFVPYSKYPACYKDVTFWLPAGGFHENDFFAAVREAAGDLVERVELLDNFRHPKTGRTSHCYRILYRHMDRNLTNEEVDLLQADVRRRVTQDLQGELR